MKVHFKITRGLLAEVRNDLNRPHPFASERVGFLSCQVGGTPNGGIVIILAHSFHPVADDDYLDDPSVGAMMGPAAIRKALEFAYHNPVCMFHVHMHDHSGTPKFSRVDVRESRKFVPDFWHVRPEFPHGTLVLSLDDLSGRCWIPKTREIVEIGKITVVGMPLFRFGKNRYG